MAENQITVVMRAYAKLHGQVVAPIDYDEETLKQLALSSERVKKFMDGKAVQRVIVVPQKLVNIVLK